MLKMVHIREPIRVLERHLPRRRSPPKLSFPCIEGKLSDRCALSDHRDPSSRDGLVSELIE
jgi:hypothetical protein